MRVTTMEERIRIGKLSQKGFTDREIARQFGLSMFTIRKWRRRGKGADRQRLVSRMGRPVRGALSSYPKEIVEVLSRWRQDHPGWGPKTLRTELALDERFLGKQHPSRSSIARWLKESQRVRLYEKHSQLPRADTTSAQSCHAEWELDAKGYQQVPDLGLVSLININDTFSRVRLISHPCWLGQKRIERYPATEDYQQALRLAFCAWGLPDQLATDHDRIFYDETSKSPFPTRFHLWLLSLGIQLKFGRLRVPEDQAITERSHQIWDQQVLEGSHFESVQQLRQALHQRQLFLNEHLPCASLHEQPPLLAYPQARLPKRPYRPEYETDLMDLQPVYTYLSQGQWFRKVSAVGSISIGRHIYHLGYDWRPDQYVDVTFQPEELAYVCRTGSGKEKHFPAARLTKAELIGELLPFQLPAFQLALPFSWHDWRALLYTELPTPDTTL